MITKNEGSANRWNTISFVMVSLVNFLVFTLAFKKFEYNLTGFYLLLTSIFLLGGNLDLGFGISTIKLVATANKKNDIEYLKQYFLTYFFAYILLVIIIVALQYLYFAYFTEGIGASKIDPGSSRLIYFIVCLNFVFTFLYNYFRCFLEGLFLYVFISKTLIVSNFLLLAASFIVAFSFNNFFLFISVTTFSSFVLLIAYVAKILMTLGSPFRKEYFNLSLVKGNISYSGKLQISFFIGNSIDYIIKYLITIFLSLGFVTIYESGKKFTTFINGFIYSSQKVSLVKFSDIDSAGAVIPENVRLDLKRYAFLAVNWVFFFYGILNPLICTFLYYWFNNVDSSLVFLLLSLPQTLICIFISLYNVIIIEGKKHYLITMQLLNVIFTTLLTCLWFILFKSIFGLLGYYIATIINVGIILYYFRKFHSFSIKEFVKNIRPLKLLLINILVLAQIILIFSGSPFNYTMIAFEIAYLILYHNEFLFILRKLRLFNNKT